MKNSKTKEIIYKVLYVISAILFLCFAIFSIVDRINYNPNYTSAPLYVCFLLRGLEFLLPCCIALIIAIILHKQRRGGL